MARTGTADINVKAVSRSSGFFGVGRIESSKGHPDQYRQESQVEAQSDIRFPLVFMCGVRTDGQYSNKRPHADTTPSEPGRDRTFKGGTRAA